MTGTLFSQLADLGERLEQTSKRLEKTELLAEFLSALSADEIPVAVRLIIGQVFPEWDERALNLSGKAVAAAVDELVDASPAVRQEISTQAVDGGETVRMLLARARVSPPALPSLTILDVYASLEQIASASGRGSRGQKVDLFRRLLLHASPIEAKYLVKVIYQEMRHGVNEGILLDGISRASGVKSRVVRRANQLWGDLGEVALAALTQGALGLSRASIRLFRPIKPMLAHTAESLAAAFDLYGGRLALEYKLDGARVQIHLTDSQVRIYSRQLSDVTDSLPDIVAEIRSKAACSEAILEGEVVAVDEHERPLAFQHLMRRFRRTHEVDESAAQILVQLYLFDLLYLDGRQLIDEPNTLRWQLLQSAAGALQLVSRKLPADLEDGQSFAQAARQAGHEGVMIKDTESAYTPGVRGKSWLKLKHVLSFDLVVVAADWGYGRRHGWLSNYHLAARDQDTGEYAVVGKTYKGLTDAQFEQMTKRLLALERRRERSTVHVRTEVVVEVLFNEIQASSQYESGLALRFARISRIRDDKSPEQADSIQTLRGLYDDQFQFKGRPNEV